jgi:hypothetical protein
MLDKAEIIANKIKFYEKDIDRPFTLNSFNGTFAIESHKGIPEQLQGYLQRHFGVIRLSRIKIEAINEALNEVWEGPGSLKKIFELEYEYEKSGKDVKIMPSDIVKKKYEDDEDDIKEKELMSTSDVFDVNG